MPHPSTNHLISRVRDFIRWQESVRGSERARHARRRPARLGHRQRILDSEHHVTIFEGNPGDSSAAADALIGLWAPRRSSTSEHEPAHVLSELKREMGPIAFSAQYQQTPIPPGGTIIKRKWLTTHDEIASRPDDRIVMSWDIALSEIESGDYSACVVLLIRKEIVYILEVVRGRFPFEALKRRLWSSSGGTVLPLF